MSAPKSPLRQQFERERRRAAFLACVTGIGIGVIVADTWFSPLAGIPGGIGVGCLTYGVVWAYESYMWKRHHG